MVTIMKDNFYVARGIFTVVFMLVIIVYPIANLIQNGEALYQAVYDTYLDQKEETVNLAAYIRAIENVVEEELLFREPLVEAYGMLNMAFGKHEDNSFDTLKGKDGLLYNGNFWAGFGEDQKEFAVRTRRLHDQLAEKGTQVGVVIYPMKVASAENRYYGLPYDDYTEISEEYLRWLRYYKVPALDLSNLCEESGMTIQEAFFGTDHHWTPEAAFEGFVRIIDWMNESFQADLDGDGALRDPNFYVHETYEKVMFGSEGRKTGIHFAGGLEDMTVIYPKAEGDYILKNGELDDYDVHEGSFYEALLDVDGLSLVHEDIYGGHAENIYLHGGVTDYVSIENLQAPSDKKILLIRDSYSTPVGAFLAQPFQQVDMLWFLEISEEELERFLEKNHYDYVLLAIYPTNLVADAFPFGIVED